MQLSFNGFIVERVEAKVVVIKGWQQQLSRRWKQQRVESALSVSAAAWMVTTTTMGSIFTVGGTSMPLPHLLMG